jgi:hypothetical protein
MYSLIWQSVTWRPGKLRFLIGVKNPLPIRPTAIARKHGPLRGRAVRQIRTSVGLRPPFVAHPATVSHPDRRALLISSVAQHHPFIGEVEALNTTTIRRLALSPRHQLPVIALRS